MNKYIVSRILKTGDQTPKKLCEQPTLEQASMYARSIISQEGDRYRQVIITIVLPE